MKMAEAKALVTQAAGYRVHFERRESGLLHSDYFPDQGEPTIADEDDAWKLAAAFAEVDPSKYVNVYVIAAFDHVPVPGYTARKMNVYPPPPGAIDKPLDPPESSR